MKFVFTYVGSFKRNNKLEREHSFKVEASDLKSFDEHTKNNFEDMVLCGQFTRTSGDFVYQIQTT